MTLSSRTAVRPLRSIFLVLALVFAQMAAAAHAIEHIANDGDGLPTHACERCLSAHSLGGALPSTPPVLSLTAGGDLPPDTTVLGRASVPPPLARQGAPPSA